VDGDATGQLRLAKRREEGRACEAEAVFMWKPSFGVSPVEAIERSVGFLVPANAQGGRAGHRIVLLPLAKRLVSRGCSLLRSFEIQVFAEKT